MKHSSRQIGTIGYENKNSAPDTRHLTLFQVKTLLFFITATLLVGSCYPVLNTQLMKEGLRDIPIPKLKEGPEPFKGRLFVFGGVIVEMRLTENGSLIEALAMRVDRYGHLKYSKPFEGRVLALYPREKGLLDPVIYRKGREITFAGVFVEIRKGRIDEMEYHYPVFEIKDIYLWAEQRDYYTYPYYRYYRYPLWWYDPWWDIRWRYYPPY